MSQVLNSKSIEEIRQFFKKYEHLSTNDQAQIAGVAAWTIRAMRKRAGIKSPKTKVVKTIPIPKPIHSIPTEDVPDNWRNDVEWLTRMATIHNIKYIARLVNRDRSVVKAILRRNNIKTKSLKEATKSKNKCCTHAWCHKHYVELGYTQQQCADLAGISQQAFSNWLNRFKIAVRDVEQTYKRKSITLWEKEFIAKLRQQPTVRRVYVRDGYIHVRFMNYFWENYCTRFTHRPQKPYTYFAINEENTKIEKIPTIYPEYGVDLEGKPLYPAHISLSKTDLNRATLAEKRLAIHEYARQLITRGWIHPTFPYEIVKHDWEKINSYDLSKYLENGGFTSFPKIGTVTPYGKRLMMNFFDFSIFGKILARPQPTIRFLNMLADRGVKFNLFNLLLVVAANKPILKRGSVNIPDPIIYAAIFKHLKLEGSLFDINVGMGNRAVAAAMAGLQYTTNDHAFTNAIERGFLDITGLEFTPYTNQKVDIAIYDEGFRPPDMTKVMPYLDKARKLFVFCPYTHAREVFKHKPQTAIRVRTRLYRKIPDYLFVW